MTTAILGFWAGLGLGMAIAATPEPEIVFIQRPCPPCLVPRGSEAVARRKPSPAPEKLALKLRVSPLTGFAPLTVQARIRVTDPEGVLLCPRYTLLAQVEKQEPDYKAGFGGDVVCDGTARVHAPRPRPIALRRPGTWEIHASLADHGLTLHDRQTVTVIGRGAE